MAELSLEIMFILLQAHEQKEYDKITKLPSFQTLEV